MSWVRKTTAEGERQLEVPWSPETPDYKWVLVVDDGKLTTTEWPYGCLHA